MRAIFALLGAALVAAGSSRPARQVELAIRLHPGEHLIQHVDSVDRTAWILPRKRLAYYAKSGAVITEELRAGANTAAVVTKVTNGTASLRASVNTIVVDVPRHRAVSDTSTLALTLSARNESGLGQIPAIEDAAMAILPDNPVAVGSRWLSHARVKTALGSGEAAIEHSVTHIDGNFVEISVYGGGAITGREYNLPRLLPGTMHIRGNAWYDTSSGLITHQSYLIHNRLVKPARDEFIGFDETLSIEITTGIDHRS
jgi:hypothetical protein